MMLSIQAVQSFLQEGELVYFCSACNSPQTTNCFLLTHFLPSICTVDYFYMNVALSLVLTELHPIDFRLLLQIVRFIFNSEK